MQSLVISAPPQPDSHTLALPVQDTLDQHPAAVYLARLAPGSRRVMRASLDAIAGLLTGGRCDAFSLDWAALEYRHTTAVRALLADLPSPVTGERYAPATANRHLAALRGVLKECWRLGRMDAETYRRAADLEPIRGSRLPRGRALPAGEVRALFADCASDERTALAARDAALLACLYGAGLRRAEAVGLDLADYTPDAGALKVHGKGNKERLTYLTDGGRAALEAWVRIRGSDPGPLFLPLRKGGKLQQRRLTEQAVLRVSQRRAREAGVPSFSPHDLRRTFIGDLLDAGADLSTVQQLAGHAQPQTTARYDRRGEATKKRAAQLLHVPFEEPRGAVR